MPYEVASNKPAAAGYENGHLLSVIQIRGQKSAFLTRDYANE
jgi:hypothetical protein